MEKEEQKKRVRKARTKKEKIVETAMMKPYSIQRSFMNTYEKLSNAGS